MANVNEIVGGDIGQNAFGEIDIGEAGADYGWNVIEGPQRFQPGPGGPTSPIHTYDRMIGVSARP